MNTISPAPAQIKRLPPGKRAVGIFIGVLGGGLFNLATGYSVFQFYSRNTHFVPYDTSDADLTSAIHKSHNPASNPPVAIDHAVRVVPLDKLKVRDQAKLTTEFCRGIWSGMGYAYQRRYLEKKYKALPGREKQLWSREELGTSAYEVGTQITDHFEVLEHSAEKVIVRCGDSPLNADHRESDGLFSMEVTMDEKAQTATFHLKSVFVDTTPAGKNAQPLPWTMQFAHRLYTKLWMETAVRRVLK